MRTILRNKWKLYAIVISAAALFLIGFVIVTLAMNFHDKKQLEEPAKFGSSGYNGSLEYDPNAVVGGWDEVDRAQIIASLNDKVAAGMINISMNTNPVFDDGESAGNLMIVNETVNRYPQIVEISRNDNGRIIYTSGMIPVGSKIEAAKLDVALPEGAYACTALFYNVDPETNQRMGCAGASIRIIVLK